jgi:hypothetical protein
MAELKLYLPGGELQVVLNESPVAQAILRGAPYQAEAQLWGKEIYFSIPLRLETEHPAEIVQKGDVGYWPPGQALCFFFGPTPGSKGEEIRPASPVEVIGKMHGDFSLLEQVQAGDIVRLAF